MSTSNNLSTTELLSKVLIFKDLSPTARQELAVLFTEIRVPENHVVFEKDRPSRSLYILKEGSVVLGAARAAARMRPGDAFGFFGISVERERSFSARTLQPSRILVIPKEDLLRFAERYPMVALRLQMAASRRLRRHENAKGRPLADRRVDLDIAVAPGDSRVDDSQAKAGALAFILGAE